MYRPKNKFCNRYSTILIPSHRQLNLTINIRIKIRLRMNIIVLILYIFVENYLSKYSIPYNCLQSSLCNISFGQNTIHTDRPKLNIIISGNKKIETQYETTSPVNFFAPKVDSSFGFANAMYDESKNSMQPPNISMKNLFQNNDYFKLSSYRTNLMYFLDDM